MSKRKQQNSGWPLFKREFANRTIAPAKQPTYVWYFLASMLAGTIGIWITIGENWLNLPKGEPLSGAFVSEDAFRSMLTFFAALGSASCARIVMIEDKAKHLRSFFGLLLVLFSIFAFVTFAVGLRNLTAGVDMAFIGSIAAIITWWMANWDKEAYEQETDPPSLGGNPGTEPAGDTKDYNV